jgi:hypothetical protein
MFSSSEVRPNVHDVILDHTSQGTKASVPGRKLQVFHLRSKGKIVILSAHHCYGKLLFQEIYFCDLCFDLVIGHTLSLSFSFMCVCE